ncbi:glycoside hydrolase family 16 protein [Parablastomonas sp. CN1-191]|uniref:glycoside hydrolase family 16 protein n=1 Tax=Parablastomonas sp. CN1-191 TaxID=3400908 RepID=UPI003BF7B6DD
MSALLLLAAATAAPAVAAAPGPDWQLVWADEFDGAALDPAKWTLADDCWGGGNNERQCYTPDPANHRVAGGQLEIVARKERHTGPAFPLAQRDTPAKRLATASKPFTSARLSTTGLAAWRYGRVEIRARFPQGQGTWPAAWMLPEDWKEGAWPRSGEIDIVEAVNLSTPCKDCRGGKENHVLGTIHFGNLPPRNRHLGLSTQLTGPADGWHTYAIEWSPAAIAWFVDGRRYETRSAREWRVPGVGTGRAPFDKPFHLILNLAIGGGLAESRNLKGVAEGGFPKTMAVDWVRVWQKPGPGDKPAAATGN